jgi:hypothetical protein
MTNKIKFIVTGKNSIDLTIVESKNEILKKLTLTPEGLEQLAASMQNVYRCGGLDYDELGPIYPAGTRIRVLSTVEDYKACLSYFGIDPVNVTISGNMGKVQIIIHKQRFKAWCLRNKIYFFIYQRKPIAIQVNMFLSIFNFKLRLWPKGVMPI